MRRISLVGYPVAGSIDDKIKWLADAVQSIDHASNQADPVTIANNFTIEGTYTFNRTLDVDQGPVTTFDAYTFINQSQGVPTRTLDVKPGNATLDDVVQVLFTLITDLQGADLQTGTDLAAVFATFLSDLQKGGANATA